MNIIARNGYYEAREVINDTFLESIGAQTKSITFISKPNMSGFEEAKRFLEYIALDEAPTANRHMNVREAYLERNTLKEIGHWCLEKDANEFETCNLTRVDPRRGAIMVTIFGIYGIDADYVRIMRLL